MVEGLLRRRLAHRNRNRCDYEGENSYAGFYHYKVYNELWSPSDLNCRSFKDATEHVLPIRKS